MENDKDYMPGEWLTAPAEGEDGQLIMVTGRTDVTKYRDNPRFAIRGTLTWDYAAEGNGMPSEQTAVQMEQVQERLVTEFRKDPVAVLTGIYTGGGLREWVFYCTSIHIFSRKVNEQLADLPLLPLSITAAKDPAWEEYDEMMETLGRD